MFNRSGSIHLYDNVQMLLLHERQTHALEVLTHQKMLILFDNTREGNDMFIFQVNENVNELLTFI